MSEMGEVFDSMRQHSQQKRARNRESSPKLLDKAGLSYTTHNAGAHLIVEERADFWPGTGKWIIRGGRKGRGVRNLIKALS